MPVLHNLDCRNPACTGRIINAFINPNRLPRCPVCKGRTEINWMSGRSVPAAVHSKERSVVYRNPKTGSVAYPGRNDLPMPDRYARNGYERVEFDSLNKLDKFCAEKKLVNETASFDKGSGRADNL